MSKVISSSEHSDNYLPSDSVAVDIPVDPISGVAATEVQSALAILAADLSNVTPVYIQNTNPGMTSPGVWIDTTGGNLSFFVETGT